MPWAARTWAWMVRARTMCNVSDTGGVGVNLCNGDVLGVGVGRGGVDMSVGDSCVDIGVGGMDKYVCV